MKILDSITTTIFDKMDVVVVFLIVSGGMYIINIILGSLNAIFTKEFDWKKHLYGIAKAIVMCLCILAFCVLLNLFSYGLGMIDIVLPDHVITVLEVIGIIVVWCYDLAVEIVEKIKGMKSLKYIKYEDVQTSDKKDVGIG